MKLLLHLLTFARRQARRSSGPAADQVRAGDQPQDRQCDGHYSSPDISGTRSHGRAHLSRPAPGAAEGGRAERVTSARNSGKIFKRKLRAPYWEKVGRSI